MTESFIAVQDEAALNRLLAPSQRTPVVLLLSDPFCGGSAIAEREMAQLSETVHMIDVSSQQPLSRIVAERTGIRHESPQAFVLHAGQVVWSRSHFAITAKAVREALRQCGVPIPR